MPRLSCLFETTVSGTDTVATYRYLIDLLALPCKQHWRPYLVDAESAESDLQHSSTLQQENPSATRTSYLSGKWENQSTNEFTYWLLM